ncbi:amidohydrolase [Lagierella sp.]|uniref:amidohydrolase n=1 Tax=Lagierella sp. TaxID=2849657 RepID=UPI002613B235|nr:amidohydrolase [Lagierella sp.]
MENQISKYIDEKKEELIGLAKKIWENPEVSFQEYKAVEWYKEFLEKEGFDVTVGDYGVPTSIRASYGSGSPVIGFLGEYDALRGMSQVVDTVKKPVKEGDPGHACQHNLLGVGHLGAAIALKNAIKNKEAKGTVVFYGCPGEEELTGKGFMARGGAFRDLDVSFSWHPGNGNAIVMGKLTALNTFEIHYKGQTAHAAADPQNGRSALDALELTNVGVQYLREHVTDDVRIHYSILNGGKAPNIVPDSASSWYFVRALSREAVTDTYERIKKVAEGAAIMTETESSVKYLGGCYNTLGNKVLADVLLEAMKETPSQKWSEEDIKFAQKMEEVRTNARGAFPTDKNTGEYLYEGEPFISYLDSYGSSDVGDVQHICPGILFITATTNLGAAGHSWQNTACAGMGIGFKGMLYAAKSMGLAGLKLLQDENLVKKAKEQFKIDMQDKEYICPIPKDLEL